MNNIVRNFIEWSRRNKWNVVDKEENSLCLNTKITSRYKQIPSVYLDFLHSVKEMISPDEKTWFLCEDVYNDNSEIAFKWNEFELLSLDAAEGDEEWKAEIISWWDNKLPIVMSVSDGYSYYAIDMSDHKNSVVRGFEPEFEDAELVASSIEEFLKLIMQNKIHF